MAKQVLATVLDQALNYIKNNCLEMTLLSSSPTTYTDAHTTLMLAHVVMAAADFTLAAGDVSGRKVSNAAKSAVAVTNAGTATYAAWNDTVNLALLAATTTPATALAAGGTVDIGSWKFEINNPT